MKCINNKRRLLCLVGIVAVFMSGCGQKTVSYKDPYDLFATTSAYGISSYSSKMEREFFSSHLCVVDDVNIGTDSTHSEVAEAAGVFNLADNSVPYAQNLYEKLYPASTTKILTAYLALKYGNLDDLITVSENAANQSSDSSVCGLRTGDVISLHDLLYGLLLKSGNDAAVAIAEHISGSTEAFADLMNQEALEMGATKTHFVNPHGLPDEQHYTCVYDLYLMMQNAVQNQTFVEIIGTMEYEVFYTNAAGESTSAVWNNTNRYLLGKETAPDGIQIIGGKTGTTGAAGYCLVLYSYNAQNEPLISIVLKSDGRSNLYLLMNEILATGAANAQ